VFLPGTDRAVTGTEGGDILVWEVSKIKTGIGQPGERKLEKVVILNNDNFNKQDNVSINILLTVDKYLVCGNQDGTIRFYDFQFKAAAWFEDQDLSTIKSISFSKKKPMRADGRDENDMDSQDGAGENSSDFACSDFLVADSAGMIAELKATMYEAIETSEKQSKTLWSGVKSPVSAIAVHPHLTIIAIATDDGWIGIYDYMNNFDRKSYIHIPLEDKKEDRGAAAGEKPKLKPHMTPEERALEREKQLKNRVVTCMEFTPTEGELLVGLVTGEIKVIDGEDFQLVELANPL
jgi:WD40 repeat protein